MSTYSSPTSKKWCATLACALGLVGCGVQSGPTPATGESTSAGAHRTFMAPVQEYETPAALLDDADVVVQGVVLESRVEQRDLLDLEGREDDPAHPQHGVSDEEVERLRAAQLIVQTVYRLEVTQAHDPGQVVGDTIEVVANGGMYAGTEYSWSGVPELAEGREYVLLLFTGYNGAEPDGPPSLLNSPQAAYLVGSGGTLSQVLQEDYPELVMTESDLD